MDRSLYSTEPADRAVAHATRLQLAAGAGLCRHARGGAQLICLEGRVRVVEHCAGQDGAGVPVDVPLVAGQAHRVEFGGAVTVRAQAAALVVWVEPASRLRAMLAVALQGFSKWVMITFIRRGVEQSGSSSGS
ncbi:hypothetical protein NB2BOR_A18330 [Bordetella parapertussis]|nr:hypothetical protein NB2BOR_A18330 [Bordetella parapertussis]